MNYFLLHPSPTNFFFLVFIVIQLQLSALFREQSLSGVRVALSWRLPTSGLISPRECIPVTSGTVRLFN